MKRLLLALACVVGLSLMATAEAKKPAAPPAPPGISLSPNAWSIRYSQGMPGHPSALVNMLGWFFDFPGASGYVGYVTTPGSLAGKSFLTLTAQVVFLSGTPEFNFLFPSDPGNTCPNPPANISLYFERKIDFHGPSKGCGITCAPEEYRWWSHQRYILTEGANTLTVPLTIDEWSDTFGQSDPTLFQTALDNSDIVGMTFGGGCFAGHGVNCLNGTARLIVTGFNGQ